MALLSDQEVQLRISARAEGEAGVKALTVSVDDLEKELQSVGETARKSGEAQAEAAAKLAAAKTRLDDVKLSLMSAKNEYKYLAERAKESGAAQSIFADQAAYAKNRIAALNSDLVVARGNVRLASNEHRTAAREVRTHANEQQRLAEQLRIVEAESKRAGLATDGLANAAKTAAKSLVGIEMGRQFIEANIGLESLERALTQILGSSDKAAAEIDWLRTTTNKLGIDTLSAAKAYTSLAASAKGTSLEGEGTRRIFEAVAGSMAKLGKSSADTEGALQALSQMMGKGVVSMEEMRQQLAERLPGAMQATADELGITVGELTEMISTGNVLAEDVLPKLAAGLEKMYGTGAQAEGTVSAWNRLKNAVAETFQFVGESGVMTALAAILGQVAIAVRGLTGAFELLGRIAGISLAAIVSFDWRHPIDSIRNWKDAVSEAAAEIQKEMDKAKVATGDAADSHGKLAEQTKQSAAAAANASVSWLTVVNAYRQVATAAQSATEQAVKSSAARQEEGKASLSLANLLGSETDKRNTALAVAAKDAESLQTLANARQHEASVAKAQAEALATVANAEGTVSEQKRKAIQEATDKAAALQSEADKSAAAALAANQHAAALQTETAMLADNSLRTAELKSASEQAAAALAQLKAARDAGIASAQQVSDAEIKAAQAAALYRDALKDQTAAIESNAKLKQSQISVEQAGIRLSIERQRTILEVARAQGDEYGATQALLEIKKLEIKLAELTAKAKRAEADAALLTIKAKREEMQAAGTLTSAKEAELKAQEAGANVKKIEAQIAEETAKRMRDLADATDQSGQSSRNAADGYGRLTGDLQQVGAAADEAADKVRRLNQEQQDGNGGNDGVRTVTTSPVGKVTSSQVDFTETFYRRGASIEEKKLAEKYVGELYARNQATMLTGNLGNEVNASRMMQRAINDAVDKALAAARQEKATGQAVDLGTSVGDIQTRNLSKTPLRSQDDMISRIKAAGNEAKQQVVRVDLRTDNRKSSVNVSSQADATALISTLKELQGRAI